MHAPRIVTSFSSRSPSLPQVTESMEEYLSLPPRRLAHLTQRCQHKTTSSRLIEHVRRSYPDTEHAVRMVQRITSLDERRKAEFSATMKELVVKRVKLAHSLTHTLSQIEKKAQVFLIKPIYTKGYSRTPALITPIARALPLVPHRTSRPKSTAVHGNRRTPQSLQLVNRLLQSRQSQMAEQKMTGALSYYRSHTSCSQTCFTVGCQLLGYFFKTWNGHTVSVSVALDFTSSFFPPSFLLPFVLLFLLHFFLLLPLKFLPV